jgi:hypothetical protein
MLDDEELAPANLAEPDGRLDPELPRDRAENGDRPSGGKFITSVAEVMHPPAASSSCGPSG